MPYPSFDTYPGEVDPTGPEGAAAEIAQIIADTEAGGARRSSIAQFRTVADAQAACDALNAAPPAHTSFEVVGLSGRGRRR